MIEKLTPEQEALIPVYREKWKKIALSTEPIDREKAKEVVKAVYALVEKDVPQIIFCDSPYAAIGEMLLLNSSQDQLGNNQADYVLNCINSQLQDFWNQALSQPSSSVTRRQLLAYLENPESDLMGEDTFNLLGMILRMNQSELIWLLWVKKVDDRSLSSFDWMYTAATFDFFTSELNCHYNPKVYQVVERLVVTGGVIFPFERFCFVCDRPRILSLDNQNRLHAEGSPAIQFADGYSLYAYHGVTLPEKYGKLHPQEWQAKWLLEEKNAELRRVLIQGIGYSRISEELGATELDLYREYTLLKIDSDIDDEPINLLKMTCPSTGYIHVLRVPPDMRSAKDAIAWVNWGIYPEEFAVQT